MKVPDGVSLRQIADVVGVSVSTVSRALGDSDRVSPLTKQAVRDAIAGLSTRRDESRERATRPMLGVTHSHFSDGDATRSLDVIIEQVLAGMEITCLRAGYIPYPWQQSALLIDGAGDPFFAAVSGIVMSGGVVERSVLDAILARAIPVVLIGGHVPDRRVPSVGADSARGMYLATRHLLARGHRRIALANGPAETYTSFEKRAGYCAALSEAGIVADPELVQAQDGYGGFDAPAAEECTEFLLGLPDRPTAILYASDSMAEAGYRVLQRLGLRVPDDVSVVGFHDDAAARYTDPPLTTVRVDRATWGEVATEQLIALIGGETARSTRTLLPMELIVRESTGPVPEKGRDG